MGLKQDVLDFLPAGLRPDDPAIRALLSDGAGGGAFMRERAAFLEFARPRTREPDASAHGGGVLDACALLFAGLRRLLQEPDASFRRRFLALLRHGQPRPWGTAAHLKRIFESWFADAECFVLEGAAGANLLEGGRAVLEGGEGMRFDGEPCAAASVRHAGPLAAGAYSFHFFLRGSCALSIAGAGGLYFDAAEQAWESGTALRWVKSPVSRVFESPASGWEPKRCFVVIREDGPFEVAFRLAGEGGARAARARLHALPPHPSYRLVFSHTGYSSGGAGGRAVFTKDVSFSDRAFVTGRLGAALGDMLIEILETAKPAGIQAFWEFIDGVDKTGEGGNGGE